MAGLLKKFLPSVALPIPKDDDDDDDKNNVEYSFAMEYHGPPVAYDVPRAAPIDVDQIPIAAAVASASMLNGMSLPVIQPIVKSSPLDKKLSNEPKLGSKATFCPNSRTPSGSNGPGVSCESSIQIDSSGALGCANGNECTPPKLADERGSSLGCKFGDECRPSGEMGGLLGSTSGDECMAKLSDEKRSSLGCANDDEFTPKVFGEVGHSSKLGSSSGQDDLHELSGDLGALVYPDVCKEDYMNPTKSELSSGSVSSEIFSCKEEEGCNNNTPCHVKRPSVVTFRDPESNDVVHEESDQSQAESIQVRPMAERNGKKGECYRCSKGNRFTEKETCIVCGAKYCGSCVLRAMGSMPEGRKCVTCIGFQIDESKRRTLGKCSRLLKRLVNELEVKQIMRSEISCAANQLPPQVIFVNGEPLSQAELLLLQNCPKPPKKLRPGCYWYDKVSGFWGKEGLKPCQIISPQLNVGGNIKENASNGNTNVKINNREITKPELWMLQAAGVQCEGKPHFWVSADGFYQEEGQKNIRGRIWAKTRAKVACAVLSLPFPSDPIGDEMNGITPDIGPKTLQKLLLVGYEKSGTSTIYKQVKLLYNVPFSEDERQNIKLMIQSNLYNYLGILLEGREQFEEKSLIDMRKRRSIDQPGPSGQIDDKTVYSIGPRLKAFSDWLLNVMACGNLEVIFPAATREYAPFVEELWKDPAFQATYNRRNELEMLPRVATYFLERAVEISRTDYEPTDVDILYAEGISSSNGLSSVEFSLPQPSHESSVDLDYQHDPSLRYQLIRVHPRSLGENCKWLEMFEDVNIVLFCVSLTGYDEFSIDSNGVATNKMMASKQLFETIVTHPTFDQKDFLLILNKSDLLEEKIEQVPLSRCEWFHDFNPVISHNHNNSNGRNSSPPLAQRASHYIAVKFKRLFHSLTDHKLFVSVVTGLEQDSVNEALRYAREIQKWYEEETSFVNPELYSTDNEASTTS